MKKTRLALLALTLGWSLSAHAGWSQTQVTAVQTTNTGGTNGQGTGLIYIPVAGRSTPVVACASGYPQRWAVDLGKEWGKAAFSVALAASLSGAQVVINGTGTCTHWLDTESVQYLQLLP